MNITIARINPTTNRIHAMFAAVPATPLKPRTPAISAMIKKVTAQPIISILPFTAQGIAEVSGGAIDRMQRLCQISKMHFRRPEYRASSQWIGRKLLFGSTIYIAM